MRPRVSSHSAEHPALPDGITVYSQALGNVASLHSQRLIEAVYYLQKLATIWHKIILA